MTDPRFLRRVMPDEHARLAEVDRRVADGIRQGQEAHLRERVAKHLAMRATERRRRALTAAIAVWAAVVVVGGLLLFALARMWAAIR